ncbi:MAG: helicase-related protein, partial [Anaerolineales bacterium]
FLVLDELHTYRGRQGADVALLVRRVRDALNATSLQCMGTSATLAGAGSFDQQRAQVAEVASSLFGVNVQPEHIIGETLRRATPDQSLNDASFVANLRERVADPARKPPGDYEDFTRDPLSIWIESTFGVITELDSGRLIRARPRSIGGSEGAARELSQLIGLPEDRCAQAIEEALLGGYSAQQPDTGFPAFAFRLHQFISRGDTVYASLDLEETRHITLYGQQFMPGDRSRVLFPLAFCRECGQEYFTVRMVRDVETKQRTFLPRDLSDRFSTEEGGQAGFLFFSSTRPWPDDAASVLERVPEEWLEERKSGMRLKSHRKDDVPQPVHVGRDGAEVLTDSSEGLPMHHFPAPFHFCLNCGVSYGARQSSDFAKLTTLGSEGRSTATTILTLSAIRHLQQDDSLPEKARKLLSFTDNRQDASLQAGHFNDFVEIAVLRSALYRAVSAAGPDGLTHDQLTQRVFEALQLSLDDYAANPGVRFQARLETDKALRDVLGYRLYHDLRRGWRITSPNLEQCGLLEIQYQSLDEICAAEDVWAGCHPALVGASPATRMEVACTLLDFMRRELAIKVDYLEPQAQERLEQQSGQTLKEPWALDENEKLEHATALFPRPSDREDYGGNVYLSARGGFGLFLRRRSTFPHLDGRLRTDDTEIVIRQLLKALAVGPIQEVHPARNNDDVPGYQLLASALRWVAGDGTKAFRDPIRVPREPEGGARTNPFFVEFYRTLAASLGGLTAREHTAQVPSRLREEREDQFRRAELKVLFCSPTMELGVDISELNVVNMRNVPPTPANYAQRSGRAGRSGQPALVFTYCSVGSPHDQYFFRRPELMVAGAVTPPRLDLANEDLVRAHVHAIWLAETGQGLGLSLKDILDLSSDAPSLALLDSVRDNLRDAGAKARARRRAEHVLESFQDELRAAGWYTDRWLDDALDQAVLKFDQVCDRWRGLYRAALRQREVQNRIIGDASRSTGDKAQAKRLRQEAESQLELLTESENLAQSDFYSYRYFASEGFLPGYSFPRLPLSAYLPGRRQKTERDEFLSRPRFLAISEFGPRAIVYHEGSRYVINKVIMAVDERALEPGNEHDPLTQQAKLCPSCGYLHPVTGAAGADQCERCGMPLEQTLRQLFRLQNVSTKRRDRISSDEEERFRLGYELRTAVRFAPRDGDASYRTASVRQGEATLATLTYGQAATLWRINLGWTRRKNQAQYGFLLDMERGYWVANDQAAQDAADDPVSARTMSVIPFVQDRRNCLMLEPSESLTTTQMASLQAALKSAIQVRFQLEDGELAAEPLPNGDERRILLFYEAAEGGAGVLRRLVDDASALASVAHRALELCHFEPDTGADRRRGPRAKEDCEAACYDCLMSYYNQRDHRLLDRQQIRDLLQQLALAVVSASPVAAPRAEHLQALLNLCDSELEREWLRFLDKHGHRLPSKAQPPIATCRTRPDFLYEDSLAAIYVDGPHHQYPERHERDRLNTECMEDLGYSVIRFAVRDDWTALVIRYPAVFGEPSSA